MSSNKQNKTTGYVLTVSICALVISLLSNHFTTPYSLGNSDGEIGIQYSASINLLILLTTVTSLYLLIIRPLSRKLSDSDKRNKEQVHKSDILLTEKKRSIEEYRELTRTFDQNLLFSRITSTGSILHIGDKFLKHFKILNLNDWTSFPEIISIHKDQQQNISSLISSHSKTGWQGEIEATDSVGKVIWLEMHLIPFYSDGRDDIIVIASDITKRKKANFDLEDLTKKSFEQKMQQQKIISSKIIENQEKEQSRIAKDIHDGIGQMLTGLKFNIESIDLKKNEEAEEKIEQLKHLTSEIIQGVRTATFNLTPPELTDYGISSALSKLAHELSRLTGQNITFLNKSNFNLRLQPTDEINIYRIVQEAINNAVKYSKSNYIIITLSHSKNILSINIDDDGVGFTSSKNHSEKAFGGMGMTFMKERMDYVNGRLFVNSTHEKGTRITLNIPLDEN